MLLENVVHVMEPDRVMLDAFRDVTEPCVCVFLHLVVCFRVLSEIRQVAHVVNQG